MTVVERVSGHNGGIAHWIRRQHTARYRWACTFVDGATVLDAACGVGYGSAMMAQQGNAAKVTGVDVSEEAIAEARRQYGHVSNVRFLLGNVENLPFEDASFDLYTSFETIEHVANPAKMLREAVRVLRPHGILLISTPNRVVTNPGIPFEGKPFNRFHLREWSLAEFRTLLEEFFPHTEMLTQAQFSRNYVRRLNRFGKLSHQLAFRMHQACKVILELTGCFPDCSVQPLKEGFEGEVCFGVCRKNAVTPN